MAVRTTRRVVRKRPVAERDTWRETFIHYLPGWILLAVVLLMLLPGILNAGATLAGRAISAVPVWFNGLFMTPSVLAPLFTEEIDHWAGRIETWAGQHELDPNLLATVMQIESCGHPTVSSYAGAQGLFQVMPFHFDRYENQLDPDTNARRGASFLQQCLGWANDDPGMAMACYNGGPSVLSKNYANWDDQVKRYYMWGTGIYNDALKQQSRSETLDRWLNAGGSYLCDQAAVTLGIQ